MKIEHSPFGDLNEAFCLERIRSKVSHDYKPQIKIKFETDFDGNIMVKFEFPNNRFHLIDLTNLFGAGNEPTDSSDERIQELIRYMSSEILN